MLQTFPLMYYKESRYYASPITNKHLFCNSDLNILYTAGFIGF